MAILEVQQLVKHFADVRAVDGVSVSIEKGSCFGLLGPNGAGKSTTIEIIEGIIKQDSGKILYKGQLAGPRFKKESGIQFQSTALMDFTTGREILQLFAKLYPKPAAIDDLIQRCQLQDFIDQYATKLSGGQKQRLLLAVALVNDPEILFLDEPTTGLDPQSRRNFWALIESIKTQGKTVVLTTHYMDEAEKLCDTLAIMDHGKIIAEGTPHSLLKQHFSEHKIQLKETAISRHLDSINEHYELIGDLIEIKTPNLQSSINTLLNLNIDLDSLQIRQHNLEDLFIELTGRQLRE